MIYSESNAWNVIGNMRGGVLEVESQIWTLTDNSEFVQEMYHLIETIAEENGIVATLTQDLL
jgi:hypothetical protein